MADQLQLRGGTTAEHASFTGALREVTVDINKDTVVVHDNTTAGGHPLAKEDLSNVSAATTAAKLANQTVAFNGGAAATPSVTFNGDTNTGIYSPGADQLAISTNGVGRLFVDNQGRVGIGTTTPGSYNASTDDLVVFSSGNTGISIVSGTSSYGGLNFADGTTGNDAFRGFIQYQHNSDALLFGANAAERARIDSSGRLLVGTSSAREVNGANSRLVQIEGTSTTTTNLSVVRNSNDDAGPVIAFGKTRSASNGGSALVAADDVLGGIGFAGGDGVDLRSIGAQILAYVDGTPGADDMPGRLVFSTTADGASSPTERMRIRATGSTDFFATSGGHNLKTAQSGSSDVLANFYKSATGVFDGTLCARVMVDGDLENSNNSYGGISDIKLKENITDANSQWDDFKALQVRNYNFKSETGYDTHTQIGLIAQEVELVSPGLVSESPDRDAEGNDLGTTTKSVNYSVLYMKAVKALQEAMERIEQLETEMAEVKAQLS